MAMRPTTSTGTAGAPRAGQGRARPAAADPVYEDFRPVSERKQEDESDVLVLYLPGFMRENIKVSIEGKNILRVRGERLVTGSKWNRFQEDFQFPEYCNTRATRAKFEGGILTVTMPHNKTLLPPTKSSPPPNVQSLPPPKPETTQKMPDDGNSFQAPKISQDEPPAKSTSGTRTEKEEDGMSSKLTSTEDVRKEEIRAETKEKATESKVSESAKENTVEKEIKSAEKNKQAVDADNDTKKVVEETKEKRGGVASDYYRKTAEYIRKIQAKENKQTVGAENDAKNVVEETKEKSDGVASASVSKVPEYKEKIQADEKIQAKENKQASDAENATKKVVEEPKEKRDGVAIASVRKVAENMAKNAAEYVAKIQTKENEQASDTQNGTKKVVEEKKEKRDEAASGSISKVAEYMAKIEEKLGQKKIKAEEVTGVAAFGGGGGGGGGSSSGGSYDLENYKNLATGLVGGINGERQLLVNMGAAVLVIVALGAYVFYTFASSKTTKH